MDDAEAVIRLRLRKPPHWRWALRTSASAPAVRVLDAEEEEEDAGGAGVELLVDVAEGSRRRCLPTVRAFLAGEDRPLPSRSASARLRSLAARGSAALPKHKSDTSLARRAAEGAPDAPGGSQVTQSTNAEAPRTESSAVNVEENPKARFTSKIARPVRQTVSPVRDSSSGSQLQSSLVRPGARQRSSQPDVVKRYSDSSLSQLSKLMKLRNRCSQASSVTDTGDGSGSFMSDGSLPTVKNLRESPLVVETELDANSSKKPFKRNSSISIQSMCVQGKNKEHSRNISSDQEPLDQNRISEMKTGTKLRKQVEKLNQTPNISPPNLKSDKSSHRTTKTDGSKKHYKDTNVAQHHSERSHTNEPRLMRSSSSRDINFTKSEGPKDTKRPKKPIVKSILLPADRFPSQRATAPSKTTKMKPVDTKQESASVRKQKSDSCLGPNLALAVAVGVGKQVSKIPKKPVQGSISSSHLAPDAGRKADVLDQTHSGSRSPVKRGARASVIPRPSSSSVKSSGSRPRAENFGLVSSSPNVKATSITTTGSFNDPHLRSKNYQSIPSKVSDVNENRETLSLQRESSDGVSERKSVTPECEEMYVAYIVTTPDSEKGAPAYRVDSPSVSSICEVEIVAVDEDLEDVPVFRPAHQYFGYSGSFKNISDFDETDLIPSECGPVNFGPHLRKTSSGSDTRRKQSNGRDNRGVRQKQELKRGKGNENSSTKYVGMKSSIPRVKTESALNMKSENKNGTRDSDHGKFKTAVSKSSSRKSSGIPKIRVSPQKDNVTGVTESKPQQRGSAGLYSYLLKYRHSSEELHDAEVLPVATAHSRVSHTRGDSGVYSMNGSLRDRTKGRRRPPEDRALGPELQPPAHRKRRRQRSRLAARTGCGGCDVGGAEPMGSSASRHPAGAASGLAGRRAHSSGSLPRSAAAASAASGPAPGPRGGKLCKERAALCGSLPNHLDCNDASNGLDQGYGSERSPDDDDDEEEEEDDDEEEEEATCHCATYPFLNTDSAFEVPLVKGSRGLGLSVCGGADSAERWPGLVRVKRLFPQQPAWLSGRLQPGDILLAANGVSLVGLTDCQALEVLRRTPSRVVLRVVRPPGSLVPLPPPAHAQPPPPPRRDAHLVQQLLPPPPSHADDSSREFDIVLTKVNRSLGFTLRKEDESVLGHYVRALVREPALSDGRIRPGDKIVAVNDVDISPMSHEEAVMFLRQCGDIVKLRLYRDESQTPVSALSPTEEEKPFKPKPLLRKEARDMLTDLAVRKMSPGESSYSGSRLRRVSADSSPCLSPRRRQLARSPHSDNKAATLERFPPGQKYMVSSQSQTSTSDSSDEHSQNNSNTLTCSSSADADADSMRARGHASSFSSTAGSVGEPSKPLRPNFLDLCGASGGMTPQTRKPRLVFGSNGEAEWEEDEGDPPPEPAPGSPCPRYSSSCCSSSGGDIMPAHMLTNDSVEPVSMPPLSSTSSTSTAFSYRNPAYQSAVDATGHRNQADRVGSSSSGAGAGGLLKWKGVVFTPEDGNSPANGLAHQFPPDAPNLPGSCLPVDYEPGDQVFMVELTRGWNSRLGFSLQGNGQHTYISAIYADSVAAKDGRLQAGDRVIMVNDENVESMNTADIIDLLRKIRGTIGITVLRKYKKEVPTPT